MDVSTLGKPWPDPAELKLAIMRMAILQAGRRNAMSAASEFCHGNLRPVNDAIEALRGQGLLQRGRNLVPTKEGGEWYLAERVVAGVLKDPGAAATWYIEAVLAELKFTKSRSNYERLRGVLKAQAEAGRISTTGRTKGTRWWAPDHEAETSEPSEAAPAPAAHRKEEHRATTAARPAEVEPAGVAAIPPSVAVGLPPEDAADLNYWMGDLEQRQRQLEHELLVLREQLALLRWARGLLYAAD